MQLRVVAMKSSGPHHPLVRQWHFEKESSAAKKNLQCLIEKDTSSDLIFFSSICVPDYFLLKVEGFFVLEFPSQK